MEIVKAPHGSSIETAAKTQNEPEVKQHSSLPTAVQSE
jgi:hypothetical protein